MAAALRQRHELRLRSGREIDENGDENQKRIEEQTGKAEHESEGLPHRRGNFRRAHITQPDA
ncbi:MAG: hypothetical protein K6U89_03730, partial [Chloroflexi bacterium]|nr:hypothetical protein [Chloroflexota bacterium]